MSLQTIILMIVFIDVLWTHEAEGGDDLILYGPHCIFSSCS